MHLALEIRAYLCLSLRCAERRVNRHEAEGAAIVNTESEFPPAAARRIHLRVVLVQRIINRVARPPGTGSP